MRQSLKRTKKTNKMSSVKPILAIAIIFLMGFSSDKEIKKSTKMVKSKELSVAYFASGCFWCVESIYETVNGVGEVINGYAGGHTTNPTYETTSTGKTGHAETVAVYYDASIVDFKTLVEVFFGSHDPTTKNGQYPDFGSQYRSIAFYKTTLEKEIILSVIKRLNKEVYNGKIVTEVTEFTTFYKAEDYHQNYKRLHPDNPYVQRISIPRLNRFKSSFPDILKK